MSIKFPKYLWMATGGSNNIADKYFLALKDRKIVLFPDLSRDDIIFEKWNERVSQLVKYGFDISISKLLQNIASNDDKEKGLDIADYFINNANESEGTLHKENNILVEHITSETKEILTINEKRLQQFSKKNTLLNKFIKVLDLSLVR